MRTHVWSGHELYWADNTPARCQNFESGGSIRKNGKEQLDHNEAHLMPCSVCDSITVSQYLRSSGRPRTARKTRELRKQTESVIGTSPCDHIGKVDVACLAVAMTVSLLTLPHRKSVTSYDHVRKGLSRFVSQPNSCSFLH